MNEKYHIHYVLGLLVRECPSLETAARHDNPKRTESPKKTTAFKRTHTVCILAAGIVLYSVVLSCLVRFGLDLNIKVKRTTSCCRLRARDGQVKRQRRCGGGTVFLFGSAFGSAMHNHTYIHT